MPSSRDSVRRRRRAALALLACVAVLAAVAGALVGRPGDDASDSPGEPARGDKRPAGQSAAQRLPLKSRLGQLLVMSFDGTSAPDYVLRRLRSGEGTGAILFAKNAPDAATTRALTASLQRAASGSALVATDQEGGTIRSLSFAPPDESQGRIGSSDAVSSTARVTANALREMGVNVNLAPVADVAESLSSVVSGRAFAGDERRVADLTAAAVRSYGREREGATAKHFPGLGRAPQNTDDQSVTIAASRAELEGTDLVPFRAAIKDGVPLVMTSHALYPALDRARIASQSPAVIQRVLRGQLHFRGAVITDSIEAQAVLDRSDVGVAAERSITAGNDLILMTGSGSFNQVQPRLLARARRDPAFRARITESAERVLKLKKRLGLKAAY